MTSGWLTAQLPATIAADPLLHGIARIVEEVADGMRADVDALPHHLDLAESQPPMLAYVASWLGAELDPSISTDRQREVARTAGRLAGRRGTKRALETNLEALTGAPARVTDSGGVWGSRDVRPPPSTDVVVELQSLGELTQEQLRAYLLLEVPAGTRVVLRVAATPPPPPPRAPSSAPPPPPPAPTPTDGAP